MNLTHTPAGRTRSAGHRTITHIGSALLALAATVAIAFGIASPASAAVSSGGGSASSVLGCGAFNGLSGNIYMTPQRGFSSQYVGVHLYVYDATDRVGNWEPNWHYNTVTAQNGSISAFAVSTPLATGVNYQIYVYYAWWNGHIWSYAGEWLTDYTHRSAYHLPDTFYCEMY